ncbi:MAG TPA: hypothetical protein VGE52_17950, partial [Pirellulales bacterium]
RLVAATYKAAKQADPNAQIGLTVASYDPAYLRQTILALKRIGAANSFDYLCIHPYELADGLVDRDGEIAFLSMAPAIRTMLKAEAPEHADAEIWITEVGRKLDPRKAHGATEKDAAEAFAKIYLMALAQGIKRIQWFEAQDPPGEEAGFGLLKRDGSPRAAYTALKTLHEHLGASPEYLGWAALGEDRRGFGFVFRGAKGPVLAAWSPQGEIGSRKMPPDCGFAFDATTGEELARPHNVFWSFAAAPQLLPNPPADLVAEAQANKSQPFPWGGDFSQAASVVFQAGASGFVEPSQGVMQTNQRSTPLITFPDGSSGLYVRANQGTTFSVHPTFADFDDSEFYVRVTVRRLEATNIGMNVFFAAADGQGRSPYKNVGTWFGLNSSDDWQTHTWRVQGASLCKLWGFDFSLRPEQSAPFAIGKVEVSKTPFAN